MLSSYSLRRIKSTSTKPLSNIVKNTLVNLFLSFDRSSTCSFSWTFSNLSRSSVTTRRKYSTTTTTNTTAISDHKINQLSTEHYYQHNNCLQVSRLFLRLGVFDFDSFSRNQQRTMSSSSQNPKNIINNYTHKLGSTNNYVKNHIDGKHHIIDDSNSNGSSPSNGHSPSITNGDSSRHYSLDQIREQLRQCDPNCNGHLELTLNDQTGVGLLCINSPQRKNAFSGFMMAQFSDLLDQLEQWTKGQVIILYGADNFFCSGADLKTIRQNNLSDQCGAYSISALMHSNLTRLQQLPIVSIALIEGKALGGGAEIITACDFRVAAADAQIGFVHARLGVTPGFGGGIRLLHLVGPNQALQLMLSAKLIDARTAEHLGLVQHVLESGIKGDDALKATIEWYRNNYGAITPFASRAIKSIVATGLRNIPTTQALEVEAKIFCSVWGREEHKKALASNIKHHK